jgi:hypothetical protein
MTVAAGTTFATVNNTIVVSGISGAQGNDGVFGNLDEIRISNIGRSANWITTQYNSMNSPGTFIVAGAPISTTGFVMRHK